MGAIAGSAGVAVLDRVIPGAGGVAAEAAKALISRLQLSQEDIQSVREAAESAGFSRVVVLVDDLDRADPRVLPKALLAMREMLDWPGFAFVLAFDKNVVSKALSEYSSAFGKDADAFLEKIIDLAIDVPEPTDEQSARLAKRALRACCEFLTSRVIERLSAWLPKNPRSAKQVARTIGAMRDVAARHADGEIDWFAVGVQLSLRHAAPLLAQKIESELLGTTSAAAMLSFDQSKKTPTIAALVDERLKEYAPPSLTPKEAGHLKALAEAVVVARRSYSPGRIEYEMKLLFDEPSFTWREYADFSAFLVTAPSGQAIERIVIEGAARSRKSNQSAAQELVETAINGYGEALEQMARGRLTPTFDRVASSAVERLSLIEVLYAMATMPEVREALSSARTCVSQYRLFRNWLHFDGNSEDRSLRSREEALLKGAFVRCSEPIEALRLLEPWGWSSTFEVPSGWTYDRFDLWRRGVTDGLVAPVAQEIVSWFSESPGIALKSPSNRDRLVVWATSCRDSPLYRRSDSVEALETVFCEATASADRLLLENVAENALTLLEWVVLDGSGGWEVRAEERRRLLSEHRSLFAAAWRVVSSVGAQFRFRSAMEQLSSGLESLGLALNNIPQK